MIKKTVFSVIAIILLSSCDLPWEPGPQPRDIVKTEFSPALNIFGIIRANDPDSSKISYVHVAKTYTIKEAADPTFSSVIDYALVTIYRIENGNTVDSINFYFKEDSIYGKRYINYKFKPVPGEEYQLKIRSDEFPILTGETRVPEPATIDTATIYLSESVISFRLIQDPSIFLYDIYLITEQGYVSTRVFPSDSLYQNIVMDISRIGSEKFSIEIFGYDLNLASYLTQTVVIKPQSYHETYSSVINGFGCFGAVSVSTYQLFKLK
jgi:hypothetical protein